MPSGILGQTTVGVSANTIVYTVPSEKIAVLTISALNKGDITSLVDVSLSSSGTVANSEYIEYHVSLAPYSVLERGGIVLDAGKSVIVGSSKGNTSVTIWGYEE